MPMFKPSQSHSGGVIVKPYRGNIAQELQFLSGEDRKKEEKYEEPRAEQYTLDWTVLGRVCKDKQPISNAVLINRVTVEREILLGHKQSERLKLLFS